MEHNEYKIEKIEDFLEVPEDRIDVCLGEFATFLGTLGSLHAIAKISAEIVGEEKSTFFKDTVFTWIDDGKTDQIIIIATAEPDK